MLEQRLSRLLFQLTIRSGNGEQEPPMTIGSSQPMGTLHKGGNAIRAFPKVKKQGFTLIELAIVIAIIGTLAAIAVLTVSTYRSRAQKARAIQEIRMIEGEIIAFEVNDGHLPLDLTDIGLGSLRDPWGNPYQYQSFEAVPKGKWRKDKFLVPINSTYDLWSMGPDGKTAGPLTAKASRDDIIRANDGRFIGSASDY
jgi:general secretion pathway protein G